MGRGRERKEKGKNEEKGAEGENEVLGEEMLSCPWPTAC